MLRSFLATFISTSSLGYLALLGFEGVDVKLYTILWFLSVFSAITYTLGCRRSNRALVSLSGLFSGCCCVLVVHVLPTILSMLNQGDYTMLIMVLFFTFSGFITGYLFTHGGR